MCLCHFFAAACLGGFWHKVTDQCADWTPGVPAGASRIPPVSLPAAGRSSGWGQGTRLSCLIRRRLFAAARMPRQNRPFTGHRQKRRPPRCGRTGAVRKLREKSTNPAFLFYSLPPDFATVSCAETALGRGMFLPASIFARAAGREGAYLRLSAGTGDFLLLNRGGCATINTIAGAGAERLRASCGGKTSCGSQPCR